MLNQSSNPVKRLCRHGVLHSRLSRTFDESGS
jgi:hypothetical protein